MFKTIVSVKLFGYEFRIAKSLYWLAFRFGKWEEK